MTSSLYLIPLPLKGSGFLKDLISEAVWPTFCLSIPEILICVGFVTSIFKPSGTGKLIGNKIAFDRGSYLYHGRVKQLADGVRSKGISL